MATRTTHDHGDVLLVGSIARLDDDWTVEDVFRRSAAALGDHVTMLPDGELGDRSQWITFIARHTYYGHPDLETRSRHTYDDWLPKGYDDQWRFAVREGVDEIRFERIGYAAEAERSYEIFRRLRDEGAIPEGMRFLVAYPLTESAVRAFVNEPRDYEIIWRAYNDAVRRELEYLGTVIAPEDLAIQWDLARETAMIEKVGFNFDDAGSRRSRRTRWSATCRRCRSCRRRSPRARGWACTSATARCSTRRASRPTARTTRRSATSGRRSRCSTAASSPAAAAWTSSTCRCSSPTSATGTTPRSTISTWATPACTSGSSTSATAWRARWHAPSSRGATSPTSASGPRAAGAGGPASERIEDLLALNARGGRAAARE